MSMTFITIPTYLFILEPPAPYVTVRTSGECFVHTVTIAWKV